jgi:putative membrane protein
MKSLLKTIIFTTLSLYLISRFSPEVRFASNNILIATGIVLTLLTVIVKPFLKILLLPVNLITFGLFAWVINIIVIYLATLLVPGFSIGKVMIPAITLGPLYFQSYTFSHFWSYFVVSLFVSLGNGVLGWIL